MHKIVKKCTNLFIVTSTGVPDGLILGLTAKIEKLFYTKSIAVIKTDIVWNV